MTLESILGEFLSKNEACSFRAPTYTKKYLDKAKADILKLLPKKKELDDCGVVKEVCYGYNQAEKGYNQAIDDIRKILGD